MSGVKASVYAPTSCLSAIVFHPFSPSYVCCVLVLFQYVRRKKSTVSLSTWSTTFLSLFVGMCTCSFPQSDKEREAEEVEFRFMLSQMKEREKSKCFHSNSACD
jgi:hypothetical protein